MYVFSGSLDGRLQRVINVQYQPPVRLGLSLVWIKFG